MWIPQTTLTPPTSQIISIIKPAKEPEKPKPQLYTIKEGDTLTSIAEATHTSVERLWAKNSSLADPDLIEPSKDLEIPQSDETLQDRPLPVKVEVQKVGPAPVPSSGSFSSSGNTYSYGYCTWYVKNMRPDLPNNLGNADTWYRNAAAEGLAVGQTPAVGAVAVAKSYGHVAIVTGIAGNKVQISEMNYQGWNVVSSRQAPISEFNYIY